MSINIQKTYKGQSTTLNPNTFEREGYDFEGWNTERDGSGISYIDGQTVEEGFEVNPTNLYAQWSSYTFVAACDKPPYLIYSTNQCKTWQAATYPDELTSNPEIAQILYYDNRFYCFSHRRLLISSTGKQWTSIPFQPTNNIDSFIVYTDSQGTKYMMCTEGTDTSHVTTYVTDSLSADLWTSYNQPITTSHHLTQMVNFNGVIYGLSRRNGPYSTIKKYQPDNPSNSKWTNVLTTDHTLNYLYQHADKIVAVGQSSSVNSYICHSSDGVNWTESFIPSESNIRQYDDRIINHNGTFYWFRDTYDIKDTVLSSMDLISWNTVEVPNKYYSYTTGGTTKINTPITSHRNILAYVLPDSVTNEKITYTLDDLSSWNKSQTVPNIEAQIKCMSSGNSQSKEQGIFILNSYQSILNQNELFEIMGVGTSLSTFNTAWKSPSQATKIDVNNTSAMYNELLNDDYFDNSEYITGSEQERTAFKLKLRVLEDMSISIGNRNNYYSYQIVKNTDSPNFTCIQSRYNTYSEDDKNKNAPYRHRTCLYCDNININVSSNGYDFSQTISAGTILTFYFYETYDRKKGDTHPAVDMNIYPKNIDYSLNRLLLAVKV